MSPPREERRADYQSLKGIKDDIDEIKAGMVAIKGTVDSLTDAVVGTSDERQPGILPRIRAIEGQKLDNRMTNLERWRNVLAGAWAVVMAYLGIRH